MVEFAQAWAGYILSWLVIIGIPVFGAAVGEKFFPNSEFLQNTCGLLGFIAMVVVLFTTPSPPKEATTWTETHIHYYKYFSESIGGVTAAISTVLGVLKLFGKVLK